MQIHDFKIVNTLRLLDHMVDYGQNRATPPKSMKLTDAFRKSAIHRLKFSLDVKRASLSVSMCLRKNNNFNELEYLIYVDTFCRDSGLGTHNCEKIITKLVTVVRDKGYTEFWYRKGSTVFEVPLPTYKIDAYDVIEKMFEGH